jgi:hypothetical protein
MESFSRYFLSKISYIKKTINSSLLFMSWGMFERVPPDQHNIKIVIEKKNGDIKIYYMNDQFIKNNIKELDLHSGSLSGLINNYNNFYFLNVFIKDRFAEIFKNEIKFISIYKIIFNGNSTDTLIPNLDNPLSTLLYQHIYDNS